MNSNEDLKKPLPSFARRKFVFAAGMMSLFAALSAVIRIPVTSRGNKIQSKSGIKNTIITMLTQDGRLVQVDNTLITAVGKKATNHEVQTWLKK